MVEALHTKFQQLEEERLSLYEKVKHRQNDELNQRPAPGKWSALQVVDHLRQAEGMALQYMQKKLQAPDELEDVGVGGWLRLTTLNTSLRLPVKYKAPNIFQESEQWLDQDELFNQWMKIRQGLSQIINELSPQEARKGLFKHPAVGKLNLNQALAFMQVHQHRHVKQIKRML